MSGVDASKQFFYAAMARGVNKTFTPFVLGAFELKLVGMAVIPCVRRRELSMTGQLMKFEFSQQISKCKQNKYFLVNYQKTPLKNPEKNIIVRAVDRMT